MAMVWLCQTTALPSYLYIHSSWRDQQWSLNLVHYVTEYLNIYSKFSVLFWILIIFHKKIRKSQEILENQDNYYSESLNLEWIHKELDSYTPFLHVADHCNGYWYWLTVSVEATIYYWHCKIIWTCVHIHGFVSLWQCHFNDRACLQSAYEKLINFKVIKQFSWENQTQITTKLRTRIVKMCWQN